MIHHHHRESRVVEIHHFHEEYRVVETCHLLDDVNFLTELVAIEGGQGLDVSEAAADLAPADG